MTGPRIQDCCDCDGVGSGLAEDYDDDGILTRHRVACEGCAGSGRLVNCAECQQPFPLSEAEREGMYCEGCRVRLDRGDQDEERGRLGRRCA